MQKCGYYPGYPDSVAQVLYPQNTGYFADFADF